MVALALRCNYGFAPLFSTLHGCPSFFELNISFTPIILSPLNGELTQPVKRQTCPCTNAPVFLELFVNLPLFWYLIIGYNVE
jgi:hypothetical protein